jgi:hypothetical protein
MPFPPWRDLAGWSFHSSALPKGIICWHSDQIDCSNDHERWIKSDVIQIPIPSRKHKSYESIFTCLSRELFQNKAPHTAESSTVSVRRDREAIPSPVHFLCENVVQFNHSFNKILSGQVTRATGAKARIFTANFVVDKIWMSWPIPLR